MPVIDLRENKGNMTIPGIVPKPHVEDDSIKYKNIRQLPSSNDAESKIIMNIVFKNFTELIGISKRLSQYNDIDIPQKIYKEYHEIVYILTTQRQIGWDYYFNTIQKYGRDKLNDFNEELLKGIDAFKNDDLFNNMVNLDNLIKDKIVYNGVKD